MIKPKPITVLYPQAKNDAGLAMALERGIERATHHRFYSYEFTYGGWPWTTRDINTVVEQASQDKTVLAAALALASSLGLMNFLPLRRHIQLWWFTLIGRI